MIITEHISLLCVLPESSRVALAGMYRVALKGGVRYAYRYIICLHNLRGET